MFFYFEDIQLWSSYLIAAEGKETKKKQWWAKSWTTKYIKHYFLMKTLLRKWDKLWSLDFTAGLICPYFWKSCLAKLIDHRSRSTISFEEGVDSVPYNQSDHQVPLIYFIHLSSMYILFLESVWVIFWIRISSPKEKTKYIFW